jgi:pimeloyl-ACP methyl ester carboxylesterase
MQRPFHLVLLPGLGADHRLFDSQREAFPDLEVPPWIEPRPREPLADYAQRLAHTLRPSRPLVLGGVSLGGMVAWELARHLNPAALVLIATCRAPRSISPWFRLFAALGGRMPEMLVQATKPFSVLTAGRLSGAGPHASLCLRMYRDSNPRFVRWAAGAVVDWKPCPSVACPVFQIHGACDRIIPSRRVSADLVVPAGGHLINITHAPLVNRFIAAAAAKSL